MKDIVVTGFGPFPGAPFNFTKVIVDDLKLNNPSVRLIKNIYDTTYADVTADIENMFRTIRPAAIISLGITGTDRIRLERVGRNDDTDEYPDAAGVVWRGPIVPGGPSVINVTLPLETIGQHLAAQHHLVEFSDNAGNYVCNFALYKTLFAAHHLGINAGIGFMHIPPIWESEAATPRAQGIRNAVSLVTNLVANMVGGHAEV